MENQDSEKVTEIDHYIWAVVAPAFRDLIDAVRLRFPRIGAHYHNWDLRKGRICAYASFMTGPPATADEDVVVTVESYREGFTFPATTADEDVVVTVKSNREKIIFPAGTPHREVDKFIRRYLRRRQDTKRFCLVCNIWGPEMGGTIDGPEVWLDLENDPDRTRHELDAWIEATRSFISDHTESILAEIAKAERRLSESSNIDG